MNNINNKNLRIISFMGNINKSNINADSNIVYITILDTNYILFKK